MTTTTGRSKSRHCGAFTLTELMIVMTLAVILSGAMFASFAFAMRGSFAIANYADMTSEGRRGLEIFARDVRTADDVIDFSETALTLHLKPPDGIPYEITYRYDANDETFERVLGGESQILMSDVRQFFFRRFNLQGEPTNKNLETVQIQLELSMVKRVLVRETSEKIVSARFVMRNKQVTQ